jgi:hypothetical protein
MNNKNLGSTSLRRRRRPGDPMKAYDTLPKPLRHWLSEAALPWSPRSVRRIWVRSIAKGQAPEDVLHHLTELEHRTLARDACTIRSQA